MPAIADTGRDYKVQPLNEAEMEKDPVVQFGKWWQEATNSSVDEVNAVTLATATLEGKPSARMVLLSGYDENGFVFFTDYTSNKGNELANNPQACLVFYWKELERQVRIEGIVEKVSSEESDSYFAARPEACRIAAWSSPQSAVIEGTAIIEENVLKYQQRFLGQDIPRPKHWGGYRAKANLVEFWQGRPNGLHDRMQYTLQEEGTWQIERLAP